MNPQHSSKSNEWYTPSRYVEAARSVLGCIDLDPASCDIANRTVQAMRYFTADEDGLSQKWCGKVWLNPPYGKIGGRSAAGVWASKLVSEYDAGRVSEAVLLVNSATSEKWFSDLWRFPICFTDHRIRFNTENGPGPSPTHGSAFVYVGPDYDKFREIFSQFGTIVRAIQ
jgi:ParB family chromosome partitioning protein